MGVEGSGDLHEIGAEREEVEMGRIDIGNKE